MAKISQHAIQSLHEMCYCIDSSGGMKYKNKSAKIDDHYIVNIATNLELLQHFNINKTKISSIS